MRGRTTGTVSHKEGVTERSGKSLDDMVAISPNKEIETSEKNPGSMEDAELPLFNTSERIVKASSGETSNVIDNLNREGIDLFYEVYYFGEHASLRDRSETVKELDLVDRKIISTTDTCTFKKPYRKDTTRNDESEAVNNHLVPPKSHDTARDTSVSA